MKVIGHRISKLFEKNVVILFDELNITYQSKNPRLSPMESISQDPNFLEIARKYKLSCRGLRYPDTVNNNITDTTATLCVTADGNAKSEITDIAYSVSVTGKRIQVHRKYTEAAEEVFNLMTGQSLKSLWEAYCREKGIPLSKN
jgi:hypothetical protein